MKPKRRFKSFEKKQIVKKVVQFYDVRNVQNICNKYRGNGFGTIIQGNMINYQIYDSQYSKNSFLTPH